MLFGKVDKSRLVKERWSIDMFNEVCACLVWWKESSTLQNDEWPKNRTDHLLNKLIQYGQVERENDWVRVSLWPTDFSDMQRIIGMFTAGIPDSDHLDLSVDYVKQAEEDTERWRAERQAARDAEMERVQKEREAKEAAKQAVLDRDINGIRDYISAHDMNSVSVAAMARDLGMGYSRCMRLYKELSGER